MNAIDKLNVAEAYHSDIGKSIARIDDDVMKKIGVTTGDYVLIKSSKGTAIAKVWRINTEDKGLGLIRIDATTRKNVDATLGDQVELSKTEVKPAHSIDISPTQAVKFSGDPSWWFQQNLINKPLIKGNIVFIEIMGNSLYYVVSKTSPKGNIMVTSNTKINISDKVVKGTEHLVPDISYESIGGLKEEITQIREMVEIPMKHPEVFERLGIKPPKGVLLHGPPGTGKTLLARAVANEVDAEFFTINGPEIMSKFYGESEKQLRDIFEEAEKKAPSIIFIDEVDSIAPNREEVQGEVERRIVSQMLTIMDGLKGRGNVVVIAATNRPNSIDPALRRPGRFDREIAINPPSASGRLDILEIHTRGMPLEDDVSLKDIANKTHGFTGADLEILTKEAAFKALKKFIPELIKFDKEVPVNILETIKVKREHFTQALNKVEPSAMREVLIRRPNVRWDQVGGLDDVKEQVRDMVELPLRNPQYFTQYGIKAPKGILLAGPPGTGKTLLAKAVATESEANFISIKGPEIVSKYVGESEKSIREIFKKARQVAPTVIFFDEFDSIASVRGQDSNTGGERIVNQLLTELDGIEELSGVVIMAATNRADLIDAALLRPGRFDFVVDIPLPDLATRETIFKIHSAQLPLDKNINYTQLAELTKGYSGAEIEAVCQKVGLDAVKAKSKNDALLITMKDFQHIIKHMKV